MHAYEPTKRFGNIRGLPNNHWKFLLDGFPDTSFFVQSVHFPSVSASGLGQPTPLAIIRVPGSRLAYSPLSISFLVDEGFKNYSSLYWWMQGFAPTRDAQDLVEFRAARARQSPLVRPTVADITKSRATFQILEPDTESVIMEVRFTDVFPTNLGEMSFTVAEGDVPPYVTCTASFEITDFELVARHD
jgi:hypothetical protein